MLVWLPSRNAVSSAPSRRILDAEQGCRSKTAVDDENGEEEAGLMQEVQVLDGSSLGEGHVLGPIDFQSH